MNGCFAQHRYTDIADVRLKQSVQRIAIENLKDISDFQYASMTLLIAFDPKRNPITG